MTDFDEKLALIQKMIADGHHEKARNKLLQLADEHENNAAVHFDLGNLYFADGQMDNALKHYEKSSQLTPDNPVYLKSYADLVYSEKNDIDTALACYEKILALCPEDVQALMMAGHLCVSLKRFDGALAYYERVLDVEPYNREAQQFIDRVKAFVGAIDKWQGPEKAYKYCQQLVQDGRIDEAIKLLEKVVEQYPDFAIGHNDLGVLYYRLEKKERSLRCYERAVSIDPLNANIKKNLADFYLVEQGRMEEALKIYLSVLEDNPEDIDVLLVAGHTCSAMNRKNSARTFYERVLDIEPWNFDASDCLEKLETN